MGLQGQRAWLKASAWVRLGGRGTWRQRQSREKRPGEFPLWLSGLRTQRCLCEDAGSIPGLSPWVKALALPQAAVQVTDVAWIPSCCGCSIGRSCSSNSTPGPGPSTCRRHSPKKKGCGEGRRPGLELRLLESRRADTLSRGKLWPQGRSCSRGRRAGAPAGVGTQGRIGQDWGGFGLGPRGLAVPLGHCSRPGQSAQRRVWSPLERLARHPEGTGEKAGGS